VEILGEQLAYRDKKVVGVFVRFHFAASARFAVNIMVINTGDIDIFIDTMANRENREIPLNKMGLGDFSSHYNLFRVGQI
jgi:hypothetical protein